jgi:hypothetical protein
MSYPRRQSILSFIFLHLSSPKILIYLRLYSPCGTWPFFSFLILRQSVGLLRRGISSPQSRNLNTEYTQTDIHTSSGIRAHDPSVLPGKEGSCLRPRGHCDRPSPELLKGFLRDGCEIKFLSFLVQNQFHMLLY